MATVRHSLSFNHHQSFQHNHQNHPNPNPNPISLTFPLTKPSHSTQTHSTISPISSLQPIHPHPSLHHLHNLNPQSQSINTLLQQCGQTKNLETGRKLHEFITHSNQFQQDYVTKTLLITMYSNCESPLDARKVFDETPEKNLYQWNAIISGYTRNGLCFDAILLFCEMIRKTDLKPNNYTFPSVIKACGGILCVEIGRVIHGMGLKTGFGEDAYVCNALIGMYGKCGHVEEMMKVFDEMPERSVVSWNAMVFGFSESGLVDDGLEVFREMLARGLIPDVASLVTVLPVCGVKGDLGMGKVVHGLALKLGLYDELTVNNALIDMYVKCGCILDARSLFDKYVSKNVVSWNIMIHGYSREGDVQCTFDLLRQMQVEGVDKIRANAITILNVLPACLDLSELRSLKELHGYAYRNGFQNDELVANAFVSSYAKCGSLHPGNHVFDNMETKTVSS